MPIVRPYRRTCLPFLGGDYSTGGSWAYIEHPKFAIDPQHYIRAALVLQKDLLELFEYVEPAEKNLPTYSFRIHELLLRACVEIEANCKAILAENGYTKNGRWDFGDYRKIEHSHGLSRYEIRFPIWHGEGGARRPFADWANGQSPAWYNAYNESKHNRHVGFEQANFLHMTDAVCGLFGILSAQFWTHDFVPEQNIIGVSGPGDGSEAAIGGYLRIVFPANVPNAQRYAFDWQAMRQEADPFQNYAY